MHLLVRREVHVMMVMKILHLWVQSGSKVHCGTSQVERERKRVNAKKIMTWGAGERVGVFYRLCFPSSGMFYFCVLFINFSWWFLGVTDVVITK